MSNILSYNNKTAKSGAQDWIPVEPYGDDDIRQIKDPNGGLSQNPRTAIPSPFAQLDLVKNAFDHLTNGGTRMTGIVSELKMVSDALDVAQLFFEYENHRDNLHVVRWNKATEIEKLKSDPRHRLYGAVKNPDGYPVAKGAPCTVNFDPVKTTAVKLEV
ncbi:MAG: hypothetical protein IIT60_03370, partial [Muribaculaceae bacterium]|nr:hypothetical protein [Muribaculaceae bacterium]